MNCQLVCGDTGLAYEQLGKHLHSEFKYVESEIMRVWITIDALQDTMHQNPDAITGEMNKSLANLYFYESKLNEYLGVLEVELTQLDDPLKTVFKRDQFKPIHFNTLIHKTPGGATLVPNSHKIAIKKVGL
ncbi:MAG: hypothetical protein AAGF57_19565 [Pseudomonadota bacterium]